jgi:hypothetical protein
MAGMTAAAHRRCSSRGTVLAFLAFVAGAAPGASGAAETSVRGARGVVVSIDAAAGRYEVRSTRANWVFAGTLGGPAEHLRVREGRDAGGGYRALEFDWPQPLPLTASIRVYHDHPVVLFTVTAKAAVSDTSVLRFPRFSDFPRGLRGFSYGDREFAPPTFGLEHNGTPWLLYDERRHAAVLSPASNFMIASMHGDGRFEIASGLNPAVTAVPAGFSYTSLMVLESGINAAWEEWGQALLSLIGAKRPANDADVGLRYLGYWTDNGATYYYNYDAALGYAGTLRALVERYHSEGIPIRYLQLDSWWYYKSFTAPDGRIGTFHTKGLPPEEWNRYGGLLRYEAHPKLFPEGLAGFEQQIGLPLITHNRWIDPTSPYHQRYRISGYAALDPGWWREIIGYLSAAHVVTYEQDWLNVIYDNSPELASTPGAGEAFTDGMARAARDKGLTLQYCMPQPRHFLQGARYDNLTTIRVSGDRLARDKWDSFLFTSRLASALEIWPWTDVFMSRETDNLLIATLSAGMVGIGDRIGEEDAGNLRHSVRADGVIVKPDTPLVPLDAMYLAAPHEPMLAAAHTDHGALRSAYVLVYSRSADASPAGFTPAEVGVPSEAYVYDARRQLVRRLSAAQRLDFSLATDDWAYYIVVPISRSGIALFGDAGMFVPNGVKRISALDDTPSRLTATVTFASHEESVRLFGYAPKRPTVAAVQGSVGDVTFDAETGRFEVSVAPSPDQKSEQPGDDSVRRATVSLSIRPTA